MRTGAEPKRLKGLKCLAPAIPRPRGIDRTAAAAGSAAKPGAPFPAQRAGKGGGLGWEKVGRGNAFLGPRILPAFENDLTISSLSSSAMQ